MIASLSQRLAFGDSTVFFLAFFRHYPVAPVIYLIMIEITYILFSIYLSGTNR
jgi:hypothetical protein